MSTFIQNNIQFTADNTSLKKDGRRHSKFGIVENEDFSEEVLQDGIIPFINGVEIDWNNAYLPNNKITINTTGELLNLIDNLKPREDDTLMQIWEDFEEELNTAVQQQNVPQKVIIPETIAQAITQSMADEIQKQQTIEESVEEEQIDVLPPETAATTQTIIYV